MPPKRKRPPPPTPPSEPDRQPAPPSPAAAADTTTTTHSSALTHELSHAPAFLNATFSTHRLSPLHLGPTPLTQARIHTLSQRLRDLLVGDVVRGVELGLTSSSAEDGSSGAMRRAGALEVVSMGWVRLEDLLGRHVGSAEDEDADTSLESVASGLGRQPPGKRRALHISLQYEAGEYAALLLPAVGSLPPNSLDSDDEHEVSVMENEGDTDFAHLPLLLLRMPAPLKSVMCAFISRTFDCRISPLALGTKSLVGALERWLGEVGAGGMGKDVMVTLGFYAPSVLREQQQRKGGVDANDGEEDSTEARTSEPSMGIKSIDVTIPLPELRRFVKAGKAHEAAKITNPVDDTYSPLKRRRLGGSKDEESWTWLRRSPSSHPPHPITEALAAYLRQHLALDMFHPAVRVTRVACGGFVLSEGRVKLFGVPPPPPDEDGVVARSAASDGMQRGLWAVFGGLVERAKVRLLVGNEVGEIGNSDEQS